MNVRDAVHSVMAALDRAIRADTERVDGMTVGDQCGSWHVDVYARMVGAALDAVGVVTLLRKAVPDALVVQGRGGRPWQASQGDISEFMQRSMTLIEFFGGDTAPFLAEPGDLTEADRKYAHDIPRAVVAYALAVGRLQQRSLTDGSLGA